MKKLKIKGYRKIIEGVTKESFIENNVDGVSVYLEIKESGKCILRTNFQIIGWTDDKFFAFDILRNKVPVLNIDELMLGIM